MKPIIVFKRLLILVVYFFVWGHVQAQVSQPAINNPNPPLPSPNAAALGRYGDIAVSNYTGVPSIQIPIHVLKYAGLEVDINLSYHAGGVRVEDEAPWTGLNFSLNAGGMITRSIRSLDDFPEMSHDFAGSPPSPGKGYFKEDPIPSYVPESEHVQGKYTLIDGWRNLSSTFNNYQTGVNNNNIDGQPDVFNFNFNGHSGKFVIDRKRNASESYHIVLYTQEDLKIELVNNDLSGRQGFKITDDNGIEYWFQQLEVSRSKSGVARTGKLLYDRTSVSLDELPTINRSINLDYLTDFYTNRISSWYLTKIVNVGGTAQIDFGYETLPVYLKSLPSRTQNNKSYSSPDQGSSLGDALYALNYSIGSNETRSVYLSSISYPGVTVNFTTTERSDMMSTGNVSPKKLQSIEFTYQGVVKKNVILDYSYFDSGSGAADYISKRLKLNTVQFIDASGGNGGKYTFQYYDMAHLVLPDKDSYAQDLFGYYNGQRDNDSKANFFPLLPTAMMNAIFPGIINHTSNREVGENFVMAGLIRRVYYPTGGSTSYQFESNDYVNGEEVNYHIGNFYLLNGNGGEPLMVPPEDVVNDITMTQGAGVRVKEIINYKLDNIVATRKVFDYQTGKIMFGMKHFRFDNFTMTNSISSSSLCANPSSAAGSPIGYSKVQEYQYDSQNQYNGYIEYSFENEIESNSGLFVLKMSNPNFCSNVSGTALNHFQYTTDKSTPYIIQCSGFGLSTQGRRDIFSPGLPNVVHAANGNNIDYAVYDKTSNLVYRKTNHYEQFNEGEIKSMVTQAFTSSDINSIIFKESTVFKALTESTVYQDGVTTLTKYFYDPSFKHYQTKTVSTRNSTDEEKIVNYKYFTDYELASATDVPSQGIVYLKDKHIFSPIEIVEEKKSGDNTEILGASCYEYSSSNGMLQSIYAAEFDTPVSQFVSSTINASGIFSKDPSYKQKKRIGSFTSLGQPKEIISEGAFSSAYIWDNSSTDLLAEVTNTPFSDVAYTSFETVEKGNWSFTGLPLADASAPVGKKVISLSNGNTISKSGLSTQQIYKVSYWSKSGPQNANNALAVGGQIVNGWQYFAHKVVNPPGGTITLSGSGIIDELRLHPERAMMKSYVNDPFAGITDVVDANNVISYYNYDEFGRLSTVKDINKNILKQVAYNYREYATYGFYFSDEYEAPFTRNNCPSGYVGAGIMFKVPYAAYTSSISQADANQQARDYTTANGQAFANSRARCRSTTIPPAEEYTDSVVRITYSNFTSALFTAIYTNKSTGTIYNFSLIPNSFPNISLGTIPVGEYDVSIGLWAGVGSFDMSVHNHAVAGGTSISASGINFNCDCGHIEIAEH